MELVEIGKVESPLTDRDSAPKQGCEGAPDAWLVFEDRFAHGLNSIRVSDEILVLTWLDRARRDVLRVHPRGDPATPRTPDLPASSFHVRCARRRSQGP
jgi:tRNA (Thr-GGU) A37 N-methylase